MTLRNMQSRALICVEVVGTFQIRFSYEIFLEITNK